jgi:hypothetical protein
LPWASPVACSYRQQSTSWVKGKCLATRFRVAGVRGRILPRRAVARRDNYLACGSKTRKPMGAKSRGPNLRSQRHDEPSCGLRSEGPPSKSKTTAPICTPCSTGRRRAPGFRSSLRVRDGYGERDELTIVVEYCCASVQ